MVVGTAAGIVVSKVVVNEVVEVVVSVVSVVVIVVLDVAPWERDVVLLFSTPDVLTLEGNVVVVCVVELVVLNVVDETVDVDVDVVVEV